MATLTDAIVALPADSLVADVPSDELIRLGQGGAGGQGAKPPPKPCCDA